MTTHFPSITPNNIPPELTRLDQWVNWRYVPRNNKPKPDKTPINSRTCRPINAVDPANWCQFAEAVKSASNCRSRGIGFSLSGLRNVELDGAEYYLIALDLDDVKTPERISKAKTVWQRLGKPYLEVSPSLVGLRMLTLSAEKPTHAGNAGDGRELYVEKRFVTLTGRGARGGLKNSTIEILNLCAEWFPDKPTKTQKKIPVLEPETPRQVSRIRAALNQIDADCTYEIWRNIVWGVMSTGWSCAEHLALEWSQSAPHRFDLEGFESIVKSYDPWREHAITVGTVYHHAVRSAQ